MRVGHFTCCESFIAFLDFASQQYLASRNLAVIKQCDAEGALCASLLPCEAGCPGKRCYGTRVLRINKCCASRDD